MPVSHFTRFDQGSRAGDWTAPYAAPTGAAPRLQRGLQENNPTQTVLRLYSAMPEKPAGAALADQSRFAAALTQAEAALAAGEPQEAERRAKALLAILSAAEAVRRAKADDEGDDDRCDRDGAELQARILALVGRARDEAYAQGWLDAGGNP